MIPFDIKCFRGRISGLSVWVLGSARLNEPGIHIATLTPPVSNSNRIVLTVARIDLSSKFFCVDRDVYKSFEFPTTARSKEISSRIASASRTFLSSISSDAAKISAAPVDNWTLWFIWGPRYSMKKNSRQMTRRVFKKTWKAVHRPFYVQYRQKNRQKNDRYQ